MRRHRSGFAGVLLAAALVLVAGGCGSTSKNGGGDATATAADTGGQTSPANAAEAVAAPSGFAALHPAVGYGTLRSVSLEERPNPLDIVIYQVLPNELSRVAGVITTMEQTPLSHVNLRAVQDDIPNAYVKDALKDPKITALLNRYVKYTVTPDGFTIEAATQRDVEAHHASTRPATAQTPERDLSVRTIARLADIGFDDWRAYGVKASNLAELRKLDLPDVTVPDGFAVPFSFYVEFMEANGFDKRVKELLADETFRNDADVQQRELEMLRDDIKDATMPTELAKQLVAAQDSFPNGTSIRCRSSTNNEDLPNFNGAGLYDSKTQHPNEGPITKCIKQVYASVWNLRAFMERDYYRIDHLATAMGVLLHPNSSDEKANGVAVSADPVYETPDAYYVNTQLGEDLVTNPDAKSIPEALLIYPDDKVGVITRSNLVKPGTLILNEDQAAILRASLTTIHDHFAALYKPASGAKFAMEIEFKITATNTVQIKQTRSWVFT